MNSIFTRTSIRNFLQQDVEDEKITTILKAAMAAPSAVNQQPWEFVVTKDKKVMMALAACSPYSTPLKTATCAFVICYKKDCMVPAYGQIDSAISAENMLLEIENQDLGGVLLGVAPIKKRMEKTKEVLNLDDKLEVFGIIACGYPTQKNAQQDRFDLNKVHYI